MEVRSQISAVRQFLARFYRAFFCLGDFWTCFRSIRKMARKKGESYGELLEMEKRAIIDSWSSSTIAELNLFVLGKQNNYRIINLIDSSQVFQRCSCLFIFSEPQLNPFLISNHSKFLKKWWSPVGETRHQTYAEGLQSRWLISLCVWKRTLGTFLG